LIVERANPIAHDQAVLAFDLPAPTENCFEFMSKRRESWAHCGIASEIGMTNQLVPARIVWLWAHTDIRCRIYSS
jgi:hypothetical protein